MGGSGGGCPFLPSDREGEALLRAYSCSVTWNMDHAGFLPRDTAPPGLLLLTIQGPQIWIIASRESRGFGRRGELSVQGTPLCKRPKPLEEDETTALLGCCTILWQVLCD